MNLSLYQTSLAYFIDPAHLTYLDYIAFSYKHRKHTRKAQAYETDKPEFRSQFPAFFLDVW
jgi:hypothetical protein